MRQLNTSERLYYYRTTSCFVLLFNKKALSFIFDKNDDLSIKQETSTRKHPQIIRYYQ